MTLTNQDFFVRSVERNYRLSDYGNLNNCLFWEQQRWFWLTHNGWMITPASLDRDTEPQRTEKGLSERERESDETGEEEVWTIASPLEGVWSFCLSSHFYLMYSHKSTTKSDSKWWFKFLNLKRKKNCAINEKVSFYFVTVKATCCQYMYLVYI